METIGKYKIHEMASRLPMMPDNQYEALRESIKTQGLMHPIITLDKAPVVIDGRNRLKACLELGIEPQFIKLSDFLNSSVQRRADTMHTGDLTGLTAAEQLSDLEAIIKEVVIMENVLRRHLTDFQRFLQLKAVEGYPENGGDKSRTDKIGCGTLSDLAAQIGWSEDKLGMANWLDKNAPEEILNALMEGELSITTAYKEEKTKREKKLDWFDKHLEDEFDRFAYREAVRISKKLEKQFGLAYKKEFIEILDKVNHTNYKSHGNR